jgi:predicted Zn finger-like uncharacterized protein
MKVECEKCKTSYNISIEKIPIGGASATCRKCGNKITVLPPNVEDSDILQPARSKKPKNLAGEQHAKSPSKFERSIPAVSSERSNTNSRKQSEKGGFRLSKTNTIIHAIIALGLVILAIYASVTSDVDVTGPIARVFSVYLWTAFAAWIVWRISRKSKRVDLIFNVIFVLIFFSLLLSSISSTYRKTRASTGATDMTSIGGPIHLTVPNGWKQVQGLNDEAEVQLANIRQEAYLIVISESCMDFDEGVTLGSYFQICREYYTEKIENSVVTMRPIQVNINGRRAIQFDITGSYEGIKVVFVFTAVRGDDHFYQILAWTQQSKSREIRPILRSITNSFREIPS